MSDYISRKEAITQANEIIKGYAGYKAWAIVDMLRKLPSAQPERKMGKWVLTEDEDYEYCTCSECGYQNGENWMNGSDIPFCAMCGADMRGDKDETD